MSFSFTLFTLQVIALEILPTADGSDEINGHGTHVVGSIVGDARNLFNGNGGFQDSIAQHSGQAPAGMKCYF